MSTLSCCKNSTWKSIEDLGHAYSFDVILGKCSACEKYWVNVFSTATAITGHERVTKNDAKKFIKLNKNPNKELKIALKAWLDENID